MISYIQSFTSQEMMNKGLLMYMAQFCINYFFKNQTKFKKKIIY